MRVEVKREGGIAAVPGLSRPISIDTSQLSEPEAGELESLVTSARFFDLPPGSAAPPRGAADYRQYTVTVEDQGRRHTVRLVDPVQDAALQALLDFVNKKARARPAQRP